MNGNYKLICCLLLLLPMIISPAAYAWSSPCYKPAKPSLISPGNGATCQSVGGVTLQWNNAYRATSYDYYWGTTSPGTKMGNTVDLYTSTGALVPGETYYWSIVAINSCGESPRSDIWTFTTAPNQASNPSPLNGATGVALDADLSWTASSCATSHDVYFGTASPGVFQGNQTATTFDPGTLAYDTTYYWRIDEKNAAGTTTGVVWSFTTILAPPSDLAVDAVSGYPSRIDLTWTDNSDNEDGFKIERKLSYENWPQATTIMVGIDVEAYSDIGLDSSKTYDYHVCAYSANGDPAWSNDASESPCPTNPTGLSAIPGEGIVTLNWNTGAAESDVDGYNVYRSMTSGSDYSQINGMLVPKSNPQYVDNDVINGTTYYYVIKAVDTLGNESGYSDERDATPQDLPPAAPMNLTATFNTTTGEVDLNWDDNNDEIDLGGYKVYRSLTSGGPYVDIATISPPVNEYHDDVTTASANNRTYYYIVTAFDDPGSNESAYSDLASASVTYRVHNLNRGKWYYFIQTAINAAMNQEIIEVTQGTYAENIHFTDKKITLISADPTAPVSTIIDGGDSGSVITFDSGDADSTIIGFTIQNGNATTEGGGIYCSGASPTITGCVISGNNSSNNGGGLYIFGGTVTLIDTVIKDNHANNGSGGAIYGGSGASVYIEGCTFGQASQGNTATQGGGALSGCSGSIRNTFIAYNSGGDGAGAMSNSTVAILNSVIMQNAGCNAAGSATALDNCDGDIINCTIVGGTGVTCGGLINCDGQIKNCIIWGNGDGTTDQLVTCSPPTYCCIQDYSGAGSNGNISSNPSFDVDGYHLTSNSSCINTGDPDYAPSDDEADINGGRRIRADRIDMGAHEYGKVIYVDAEATGVNDGTSWTNAYNYLQDALNSTVTQLDPGDEIWVADGTYYPDENTANPDGTDVRSSTFLLVEKVAIYGGFAGGEDYIYERNLEWNITILSGDIDAEDYPPPEGETIYTGNSYHVVTGSDNTVLDGFTIKEGYVEDTGIPGGAGLYCDGTSPVIRNCTITNNFAKLGRYGGGIYISGASSPRLVNCLVAGNFAQRDYCGGIYHSGTGTLALINSTVVDNAFDGIHCDGAILSIDNSIIWRNRLDPNDLVEFPVREIVLTNGAEATLRYSNVDNGPSGIIVNSSTLHWDDTYGYANISGDPEFVNWGNWEWQLANGTAVQQGTSFQASADDVIIYDFLVGTAGMGAGMPGVVENDLVMPWLHMDPLDPTYGFAYKTPDYFNDSTNKSTMSNETEFYLWWTANDGEIGKGPKKTTQVPWTCRDSDKGIFTFDKEHFFPIDDWCNLVGCNPSDPDYDNCVDFCGEEEAMEPCYDPDIHLPDVINSHNYYFTFQYHGKYKYIPNQKLFFKASDDLFVAINNRIIVDRGGYFNSEQGGGPSCTTVWFKNGEARVFEFDPHNPPADPYDVESLDATFEISDFNKDIAIDEPLEPYRMYDFDLFFAHREALSVLVAEMTPGESYIVTSFKLGDYHLTNDGQTPSPCIDAGDNDAVPVVVETDLDSKPRYVDDPAVDDTGAPVDDAPYVDMGAYEYDPDPYELIETYAGVDKPTTLPDDKENLWDATFTGGYPQLTTVEWSVENKPPGCQVDFDPLTIAVEQTSTELNPEVRFIVVPDVFETQQYAGFVLKLSANDSFSSDSDTVAVMVYPGWVQNQPPYVNAGGPYTIDVGQELTLDEAEVFDDGLPRRYLEHRWEVVLYPTDPIGSWEFDDEFDDETVQAKITFYQPTPPDEPYQLKLWASDGKESNESYTEVTVTGTSNAPPTVDAGDGHASDSDTVDESITLNNVILPYDLDLSICLITAPSAIDDGLLQPLSYLWTATAHGRTGGATFSDRWILQPTVTFTRAGTYILTLTADDGQYGPDDSLTVVINPAPELDAGKNKQRQVSIPAVDVNMNDAWARDNTFPEALSYLWEVDESSKPAGASVIFENEGAASTQLHPKVFITGAGVDDIKGSYRLVLAVTDDSSGLEETDDVYIIVEPDVSVQPPTKKSVYVISNTNANPSELKVYEVDDTTLIHQTDHILYSSGGSGSGAVGLAVDTECEFLFVTFENRDFIELVDAKAMEYVRQVQAPGASNLAGIVMDHGQQKVYTINRSTNHLYVYSWDPISKFLTLDGPSFVLLGEAPDAPYAYDIALDEENGRLYVGDVYSNTIRCYNSNVNKNPGYVLWQKMTEFTLTSHNPIGIAVDVPNQWIYTGSGRPSGGTLLSKFAITDFSTGSGTEISVDVGSTVLGVSVNQDKGLIYLTTYGGGARPDRLLVYDGPNLTSESEPIFVAEDGQGNEDIGEPAGVVVGGNVAYKYSMGTLMKTIPGGAPSSVSPGDEITYNITYDIEYQPDDPAETSFDTHVTDILPIGVDFVSASHQSVYDPVSRTVKWYLGDLPEGANNEGEDGYPNDPFVITVKVNELAKPGGSIVNKSEIESYARYASTESPAITVSWWPSNDIVYVDKASPASGEGSGISWDKAYKYLEDAINHAGAPELSGVVKEIWVAAGTYHPGNESTDTFGMLTNVDIYGGFAGTEESLNERDLSNPDNETILNGSGQVDYIVTGADNAVLDGFTVTGGTNAGVYCNGTTPTITRCKIRGNDNGYGSGDGILCTGAASPIILNNWITDNGEDGIQASTSTSTVRNNTITNNGVTYGGYGVNYTGSGSLTVGNCIALGNGSGELSSNCTAVNCFTSGDPDFKLDGYHLNSGSLCIDAGDKTGLPDDEADIDGESRIVGLSVDIGADETPPLMVFAGEDEQEKLSVDTDIAEVTFDDADLVSIDPGIVTEDLRVQWDILYGPAGGIDWNGQQDALNPTFIFSEIGYYVLKLTVFEDTTEKDSDIVMVWIEAGLELSYSPAEPEYPAVTLIVSDYSVGSLTLDRIEWHGPDGVQFDPDTAVSYPSDLSIQAIFDNPGRYQIWAVAYDSASYLGAQDIWVPVNPQGVGVDIVANPEIITWPDNRVNLSAIVRGGEAHSFRWVKPENAEDLVHFGGPNDEGINNPLTYVEFSSWGEFQIGLEVRDQWNYLVGVATKTIIVNSPDFSCLIVDAGPDQTIDPPQDFVFLTGSVEGDNGLALTYEWLPPVDNTGAPMVTFTPAEADQLSVKALFNAPVSPGNYPFGLVAKYDFGFGPQPVGLGHVTITVNGAGDPYEPPVTVEILGQDSGSFVPGGSITVHLTGVITDNSGTLVDYTKTEWVCYSGQGSVSFDPEVPVGVDEVDVTFTAAGEYPIGLIAKGAGGNELASAQVTVSVTTQYFTITVETDKSNVTLFKDAVVNLTATVDPFEADWADWAEWTDATESIEFSNETFDATATTLTSTATATFTSAGTFYPEFVMKVNRETGPLVTGRGSVRVTVNSPDALVKAKAGPTDTTEVEGPYAVVYENNPVTVYLDGENTPLNGTITCEWDCIDWPAGAPSQPQPAPPTIGAQSEVILETHGTYKFQLSVSVDSTFVGSGEVKVVLLSGEPVVSAGRNYLVAATGQPFDLDKAYVLDDVPINTANIDWLSDPTTGVSWNPDPPHAENPSVTFTDERFYDLTITYDDGQYPPVSDTVIIQAIDAAYVYAGEPKTTIPFVKVPLNDAVVDPIYINIPMEYKWTVSGVSADLVRFDPSDSVKNPTITYLGQVDEGQSVEFTLTLEVNGKQPPYINTSDVIITVLPNPIEDNTPPDITITAKNGGADLTEGQQNVHGDILITAKANDNQGVDRIELKVTDGGSNEMELSADDYEILEGTQDKPVRLKLTYLLDHYYSGNVTLVATASDWAGNSATDTLSFNSIHNILDFTVTIAPNPDYVENLSDILTFDATLNSSGWSFEILDPGSSPIYTDSGSGTTVSLSNSAANFKISADGPHTAILTANGDSVERPFDVIVNASALPEPDAVISNLENAADYGDDTVRSSTLPEVTEGLFPLEGTAFHSVFPENVYYKVELFYKEIENSTFAYDENNKLYYKLEEWKDYPHLVVKNVTPGYLEDEYHHGGVVEGILGEIDFTSIPSGTYQMLLTVKCHDKFAYDRVEFIVNCPLKLGNIKFSQEDLSITVGGMPLSIVRTYDSFKKQQDSDFGFGWTYSLANLDIKLNEQRNMDGTRGGGNCDRNVTLTLPDGQRTTFTFGFVDETSGWNEKYRAIYNEPLGTNATLKTEPDYWLRYFDPWGAEPYYYWDRAGTSYDEFAVVGAEPWRHDFAGFTLKPGDGTTYNIERAGGIATVTNSSWEEQKIENYGKPYLKSIDLPSDEQIIFDVDTSDRNNPRVTGVTHYLADGLTQTKTLQIIRDPSSGRITQIWTPIDTSLPSLQYKYDSVGNLWKVHKLVDKDGATFEKQYETTTYLYTDGVRQPRDHFVTDIKDPRGLSPIQYVYDETGKLVATIDAKGNRIELAHALYDSVNGDYEEVTDRNLSKTRYYYNSRGNVVLTQQYDSIGQLQDWTGYLYNDSYNPDKPTSIITPVPDPANPSQTINAETKNTYDYGGRLTLTIGPENNATETEYDSAGNILRTTQWRPLITTPTFPDNYEEVSTTENVYNDDNLLIFTGVRKGGPATWHSMTLNYYDTKNRVTDTVQVNMDHASSKSDVFAVIDGELVAITSLPGYPDHAITSYSYERSGAEGDPPYITTNYIPDNTQPYRVIDPAGTTRYFEYDENGNQILSYYAWDDPSNGTGIDKYVYTVNYYDGQGRAIETWRITDNDTDPFGEPDNDRISVPLSKTVYNSISKVETVYDELGNYTKYDYDELGSLVETRTYDSGQNLLTTAQNLYDKECRVLVTVGPYAPGDQPTGTETVYDALGRVIETRRWENVQIDLVDLVVDGKTVGKTVNSDATVANAWDGSGTQPANIGWTSDDGKLPVAKATLDAGQNQIGPISYTRTVYDVGGRVKHSVALQEPVDDGSGGWVCKEQLSTYQYDSAGKQTAVVDPCGHQALDTLSSDNIALYGYTAAEPVVAEKIDLSGFTEAANLTGTHKTETQYQGTRRWKVTDARGFEGEANPSDYTTELSYDALGRLLTTIHPPTIVDEGGASPVTTYSHVGYDGLGRKEWQSEATIESNPANLDGATDIRWFDYDAAGRLTKVTLPKPKDTDPTNPEYRYFYDDYGNQAGILDPKNRLTVFKYNELNRQTARYMPFVPTDPLPENILTAEDVYTALSNASPAPDSETRQYNDLGQLERTKDFKGQYTLYEYVTSGCGCGEVGKLKAKQFYDGDPDTTGVLRSRFEFTYDALGRKVTETITEYDTDTYTRCYEKVYNNDGQIDSVNIYPTFADYQGGTNLLDSVGYGYDDVTGRKALVRAPDDDLSYQTQVGYTYDVSGRLKTVEVDKRNGVEPTAEGSTYNYNPVGSRSSLTYANGNFAKYKYDALNRLTELVNWQDSTMAAGTELSKFTYTLAADGMRTQLQETMAENRTINYTYDNLNRLTGEDAEETDSGYGYGYEATYTYDLAGNRESRQIVIYNSSGSQTITTTYTYDTDTDRLETETHSVAGAVCLLPGNRYYACISNGQITHYREAGSSEDIGHLKALFVGLPSKWSGYVFGVVMFLLPLAFFAPLITHTYRKARKLEAKGAPIHLSMFYRCLSVLLAYIMLIGPWGFEQLSNADILYQDLCSSDWGNDNQVVEYGDWSGPGRTGTFTPGYDANGSVTKKITWDASDPEPANHTIEEEVSYEYNLQNRLSKVSTSTDEGQTWTVTEYRYDPDGNRVEKTVDGVTANYLIDPYNHTGYSQVFEETTGTNITAYIIGDDVLAQATNSNTPKYLLYDGHGSTRQLADSTGGLITNESYTYDAYGVLLGGPRATQTDLLYTGEMYDSGAEMYYLRARYYNPSNGLFNRIDPFHGNNLDPQSLHKYLYAHNNPVNGIDPSGKSLLGIAAFVGISALVMALIGKIYYVAATSGSGRCKYDSFAILRYLPIPHPEPFAEHEVEGDPVWFLKLHKFSKDFWWPTFSPSFDARTLIGEGLYNIYFPSLVDEQDAVETGWYASMKRYGCQLYLVGCTWSCIGGKSVFDECEFKKCPPKRFNEPYAPDRYPYPVHGEDLFECYKTVDREYRRAGSKYHTFTLYDVRKIDKYFKHGLY